MADRGDFAEILDEYLRALEAGDAPDREALLAAHPDLAEELRAALVGIDFVHGVAPRLAPEKDSEALSGGMLGDYRLLRELGRGGMAVVYEAEQVSLGRKVALKVLPFAAVLDPKQLQRFKNEAMAAAHLRHANIVPVYGVGCERGVHYYAMQYVEGQSLAAAIRDMKRGRQSPKDGPGTPISSHASHHEPAYIRMAAALGAQAAQALDHAHQLGIVHRDVKPGNLLADMNGTLWVTDFGLASSMNDASLTITGELLGTIRYMSPEQALANRVPVDHRTDVYSLGATLYELFTLEPAFPGEDAHLLIQDIASKEPVLPRRLNPALPRDLETVILKAMSKEPGSRYATAKEMAEDLGRFLENRAVEAKRPGPFRRVSKWSQRHRALVGAAAGVLVLAVAGLATGTALLWREQEQTKAAFGTAQANLDLALQALDEIYIDEAEGHPKIREGLPRDLLEKGLGFYEAFVKENARNQGLDLLLGFACQRAGLIFRKLGEEERAVESLDRAISAYDHAIAFNPLNVRVLHHRGVALEDLGRSEEALAAYDRVLEINPRHFEAHANRGVVLSSSGRLEEALAAFDWALEIDPRYAFAHDNRGNLLYRLGRFDEALEAWDRAIEIVPRRASAHAHRGFALDAMGCFEEALAAHDRAIEIDPGHFPAHDSRGIALLHLGRFGEALAAIDRAIAIDPGQASVRINRGSLLRRVGRSDEALAEFSRALELDAQSAVAHAGIGLVLVDKGRSVEALSACDRAIEIDSRYALAHFARGLAFHSLRALNDALEAYDRAIELDSRNIDAHQGRGIALVELKRPEEALEAFNRVLEIDSRLAVAHHGRGGALRALGDFEAAVGAYREAILLQPDYAEAHCNLGHALVKLGRFREAVPCLRKGDELGSKRADWPYPSAKWIADAERKAKSEVPLDPTLAQPRDPIERIDFAETLYAQGRSEESARMYAQAFGEAPPLAEDITKGHRYNAACAAALAAAAEGADAAEWRVRALEWLRAELAARERSASGLEAALERWKRDPDLAGVRDRIDDLPAEEREAWRSLWTAVDRNLAVARAGGK